MFSFSHTEPSADLLNGSSWATSEGPQNFPEFPDHGSSHSGEAEEYIFTSGQTTPRGSKRDHSQATETAWTALRTAPAAATGGQAMSRASSSRSNGSSLSQRSQMSNLDIRGNASAFRTGSQAASSMVGMDPCLLLDPETAAMPPHMYWPDYAVDIGLSADHAFAIPAPLHVVPAQMQLGPDAGVADNSSPGSWDAFSSSISRTSSPASDEAWLSAPLSPHSSPDIQCQSPRYVHDCSNNVEPVSYQLDVFSSDRKIPLTSDYLNGQELPQLDDTMTLATTFVPRRPGYEGESARDHELYKNAAPRADGMYHCPWEGQASCNHKPEKLKCNYE